MIADLIPGKKHHMNVNYSLWSITPGDPRGFWKEGIQTLIGKTESFSLFCTNSFIEGPIPPSPNSLKVTCHMSLGRLFSSSV